MLVASATLGVVGASENIMDSAPVLGVEESNINELSVSIEETNTFETYEEDVISQESIESEDSLNNDNKLSLGNDDESLSNDDELSLGNDNEILTYGGSVSTLYSGMHNIQLSNGYTGFCLNTKLTGPLANTAYTTQPTSIIKHEYHGTPIENKLKLAIWYFESDSRFFEEVGNGYTLGTLPRLQQLIWYLCYYDGLQPYFADKLAKDELLQYSYNFVNEKHAIGEEVNDKHTYNNGTHYITYEFLAFSPNDSSYQKIIGYKKNITEIPSSYEIQKITKTPEVSLNQQVTFELVYKNTGDRKLNNVYIVEDRWDDGLVYDSFIDENNIWVHSINNDGKHVWTLKQELPSYQSESLKVIFNTTKAGTFSNYITSGDKTAENKTIVRNSHSPNLTVEKTSLDPFVFVGNQTSFNIVVTNTGDCDLGNVTVVEQIPEGLIYADYKGDNWDKIGNVFYYKNILKVGQSAGFTIVFDTTKTGNFVNIVSAISNETSKKYANDTIEVIKITPNPEPVPVTSNETTPEEPTPEVPEEPVPVTPVESTPEVPEEPVPVTPVESTPVTPEEPTQKTPEKPSPKVAKASKSQEKVNDKGNVLPSAGNPFIIALLALIALGTATLRRRK